MPILNGYEACKQICEFFDHEKKLFKVSKKNNEDSDGKRKSSNLQSIIREVVDMPLMIAYSGFVNQKIREDAEKAGFDIVIEAPLSPPII